MKRLKQFTGRLGDLDDVGVDYQPMSCGRKGCDCHKMLPYAMLGFKDKKIWVLGQAPSATEAVRALKVLRKHTGVRWKWKIRISYALKLILGIEKNQARCFIDLNKAHREDCCVP